jgi:Mg-chelatase subunit ChlD
MLKYLATLILALMPSFAQAQLNVVVVFDGSGSMEDRFSGDRSIRKMDAAKKVLIQVLNSLPADTKIGVITFSGNKRGWVYPLGTLDKTALTNAINSVQAGGGTPLGRYMKDGANELLKLRQKQKYGIYKLIIVTDGEAEDDIKGPLTGQYGILSKGILVEAIGVDMDNNNVLATKVAYRSAKNPEELVQAVKAVLAEVKDANSAEYDVIAPLDPKLALAALQALGEYDNSPVGMKPVVDNKGNVVVDKDGNLLYEATSGVSSSVWWILGIIAIVFVGIIFLIVVIANT